MTRKKTFLVVLLLSGFSLGCAGAWVGAAALAGAYWYLNPKLPTVDVLKDARMQQPLRVYSRDDKLIAEFGEKRRIPVSIDQVPERVKQAFLAAEDDRFLEHPGVDYRGLVRAAINQVLTGDRSQGGSTITMQVARNFFLTREKTYIRKLTEIFLALKIDRELSKDKILELYLNKIPLGKRAYGIAAAAQTYYGKTLDELDLAQAAMIAGLPKAPSAFNPLVNPERAIQRRNYVLGRMLDLGYIQQEEFDEAVKQPISAGSHGVAVEAQAPYLAEMVRSEMVARYGEDAYVTGMKVHTTIDSHLQSVANEAVRTGLLDYSERHGYRGPISVTTLREGIKRIELDPEPGEEGGIESVPPETGADAGSEPPQVAEPEIPGEVQHMAQAEVDEMIDNAGRYGPLRAAFVLEIENREPADKVDDKADEKPGSNEVARLYLGDGEYGELNYDGVKWARGYISANEQGPEPESLRSVLETGDLIWIRPLAGNEQPAADDEAISEENDQPPVPVVWKLTQLPDVEGALVSLNPHTGAIISLVGGFDYYKSKFNRAVQARRQPGSGFKPFVYSAALERGFTAASIINDAPVVFDDPALEGKWRPENYSGRFFGPTRLREGIVKSRNLVSIRLLISLGINPARKYAKRFGFDDDALPKDLSLALGSGTLSPLRLVSGFSVFANGGFRIEPFFIDRIENDEGKILWYADYEVDCLQCFVDKISPEDLKENYIVEWPMLDSESEQTEAADTGTEPADVQETVATSEEQPAVGDTGGSAEVVEPGQTDDQLEADEIQADSTEQELPAPKRVLRQAPRIMDARVNYIMNSILRDVIQRGTGRRALVLGRNDLGGKTGTSNDEHDAWFNGFNDRYATSVWVGFDSDRPLGASEAGSHAALPIWIDYMREALVGVPEKLPEQPEGLVTIRIDSQTGLLAGPETQDSVFEIFRTENVPTKKSESATENLFEQGDGESGEPAARPGNSVTEELF